MKKFSLLFVLLCTFAVLGISQKMPSEIKFKTTQHDFGTIVKGKPVKTVFQFKNVSKKPVIIEAATPSCGCTTPEYPKTPILPGKTAKITVGYNAEAGGHFNKSVTLKFNNIENPVLLFIKGDVK